MPANFVLLEKITVGAAGASSVTFSGIPQTGYTDLVVKASARSDRAVSVSSPVRLYPNASSSNITLKFLQGNGSVAVSGDQTAFSAYIAETSAAGATASTFGSFEIYIPNYASANYKSVSVDAVSENNATLAYTMLTAFLWSDTAAITSLQILDGLGNFVQGSTFYLYGVAKLGTTPAIVPYATGGDTIMTDGTYWYHAFKSSGTFTPTKGLSCDVLVVAGGAGGSVATGAGGSGAGGVIAFASQSLASGTGYTATIGAGGAGTTTSGALGGQGNNSQFASLTAAVGGGYGRTTSGGGPSIGGSGGGYNYETGTGASGTSGQGNKGGNGISSLYAGGGGGGAGAAGVDANSTNAGNGGAGTNSVTNWGALSAVLTATGTGVSGYIAGGGGGGANSKTAGTGGSGGGGNGGTDASTNGTSGTANTGGGAGANPYAATVATNGGSGLILVRYAV
jgi:hypothetical protein